MAELLAVAGLWILLFIGEKGGIRKTSTLIAVVDYLRECGVDIQIFEIDTQKRLRTLYGDAVTTVALPTLEMVRHDDLADQGALGPLLEAILDKAAPVIAVDVAGSVDGRVLEALLSMDAEGAARESGYRVVAFTPFTTEVDAIELASRTLERVRLVFPAAEVVPVHSQDGGTIDDLPKGSRATVASMMKGRTSIQHTRLLPRALAAVEKSGSSPYRIASLPAHEAYELLTEAGFSRPLARGIFSELVVWQAGTRGQLEKLPFRRDEPAA